MTAPPPNTPVPSRPPSPLLQRSRFFPNATSATSHAHRASRGHSMSTSTPPSMPPGLAAIYAAFTPSTAPTSASTAATTVQPAELPSPTPAGRRSFLNAPGLTTMASALTSPHQASEYDRQSQAYAYVIHKGVFDIVKNWAIRKGDQDILRFLQAVFHPNNMTPYEYDRLVPHVTYSVLVNMAPEDFDIYCELIHSCEWAEAVLKSQTSQANLDAYKTFHEKIPANIDLIALLRTKIKQNNLARWYDVGRPFENHRRWPNGAPKFPGFML